LYGHKRALYPGGIDSTRLIRSGKTAFGGMATRVCAVGTVNMDSTRDVEVDCK
jgi:hypothetical protein